MNDKKYQWILYVIVFVILSTISIQVYWNYKNYLANKQQLINDVQVSLDNAIDTYYTDLAHENTIALTIDNSGNINDSTAHLNVIDSLFFKHPMNIINSNSDSTKLSLIDNIKQFKEQQLTSPFSAFDIDLDSAKSSQLRQIQIIQTDSFILENFKDLTSKILVSITQDSLNIKTIDSLVKQELNRKNIDISYQLVLNLCDDFENFTKVECEANQEDSVAIVNGLSTVSKSSFLPRNSILKIHFSNETKVILKRIMSGILISTLLVLAVISCLFYLLKIIKDQKQLAEVKNDLISNITHEFKTPIATIGVALESIKNFNVIDDKEKTKDYLNMSSNQLSKLNMMVEKLLETATLDSDNLSLNRESIDLVKMLETITNKHKIQLQDKTLSFTTNLETALVQVDVFHIENAINNIIDNALKYGGNTISVQLKKSRLTTDILIEDNGNTLSNSNKEKVFEKFYRVPKGNTHDVKGFGIGLYYTKKIIEKHNGIVTLDLNNSLTTFKILLPNE